MQDTVAVSGIDLCVQRNAIQPGNAEPLVERLVDAQESVPLPRVCEIEGIAVTQLAGGSERSVMVEKGLDVVPVGLPEVGPEPGSAKVGP